MLANLFLHYAFDAWMARRFPGVAFERYVDDAVVHCVSEKQTRYLEQRIAARLGEVGLRLHPDKTKVVYCPQDGRDDPFGTTSFTFLGYIPSASARLGVGKESATASSRLPATTR